MLIFSQLSCKNAVRCKTGFHMCDDWSPSDWATACAGELCNFIKKRRRGEDILDKALADELADTVIYLDLLATCLGIDLGEPVISKFNEVSDRVGSKIKLRSIEE